jgi:hypothetical protein
MLPRFSFRMPNCEEGVTALSNYAYKRASATGIVVHEPIHNWASHAADALRMLAEAEACRKANTCASIPDYVRDVIRAAIAAAEPQPKE